MSFHKSTLLFLLCLSLSSTAWSAVVTTVKGPRVLIDLEGDMAETGEEFFLIDPNSTKRTAIIRITQVKGGKALAQITKGRAVPGFTLQAKGVSARPMSADVEGARADAGAGLGGRYLTTLKESYGLTGAIHMNSMQAEVSSRDALNNITRSSASMSGMGFGLGGFYDVPFTSSLAGRVFAGIEQFNASGDIAVNACAGSTSCDAKINYLSIYALGKWYFLSGQYRSWLGAGGGFMLALSKSSTALNESQISTNQVMTAALGLDVQLNRQSYIPVSLEYNMYPDSSTVKASVIVIKAGWAWNL